MKHATARLAIASATLLAFFVLWAVIAAKPWAAAAASRPQADPRALALDRLQLRLRHESIVVKRIVDRRWAHYERDLAHRRVEIAAARARHAQELAAAAQAAARLAALRTASVASAPAPQQVTHVSSAATPRVVTLPPKVQVVTLPAATPPVTSTSSSRP